MKGVKLYAEGEQEFFDNHMFDKILETINVLQEMEKRGYFDRENISTLSKDLKKIRCKIVQSLLKPSEADSINQVQTVDLDTVEQIVISAADSEEKIKIINIINANKTEFTALETLLSSLQKSPESSASQDNLRGYDDLKELVGRLLRISEENPNLWRVALYSGRAISEHLVPANSDFDKLVIHGYSTSQTMLNIHTKRSES